MCSRTPLNLNIEKRFQRFKLRGMRETCNIKCFMDEKLQDYMEAFYESQHV